MAHLALALLGSFAAIRDGEPISAFATDKVRALLAYLVVEAGRPHRRDALAELLWPGQPHEVARTNLRQALATLRTAILDTEGGRPFLAISRELVQFDHASDHWLDVAVFTALLAACERHSHVRLETCTPCARRLEQATTLYRGSFLADVVVRDSAAFEEWVLLKREWLQQRALQALACLATYYERRGTYQQAERYAWRQVELDPWHEAAHRQLIGVLASTGQRGAALRQYETCRRILEAELGVEPAPETTALAEQIRAGVFSAPRLPSQALPPQATSFVGREAEIAELAGRLTGRPCRLVTLLGPPGIGKTRLAVEVAAQIGLDFADGVVFVALAPVADPALVAQAIARTLGVQESGGQPLIESLKAYVGGKHLLLVLDNFEHVLGAAP
ncbi:MAG: AAA family ATPase, partial [Chloroflexota bacterium]|nr:AAA family ATPase [Chloroflexota bacterium]